MCTYPTDFRKKPNTVLIWDNIDFCEETISGHGTTHHTNGIGIQCTTPVQQPSEITDRVSMPRILAPFKRASSTLVSHHRKKSKGPSTIEIDTECLQLKHILLCTEFNTSKILHI
ncbi:hypothetical protein SNE40_021792 [Patella caerulea]|uniref:Uncharacterized protein n=1 Tax=Patella caerulea TaxID=87958 RepID=A0AAN8G8N2_PATCE